MYIHNEISVLHDYIDYTYTFIWIRNLSGVRARTTSVNERTDKIFDFALR